MANGASGDPDYGFKAIPKYDINKSWSKTRSGQGHAWLIQIQTTRPHYHPHTCNITPAPKYATNDFLRIVALIFCQQHVFFSRQSSWFLSPGIRFLTRNCLKFEEKTWKERSLHAFQFPVIYI